MKYLRPFTLLLLAIQLWAGSAGGELRFVLRADPKTLDPLLVSDEPSEAVRYLTAGVLVRINRLTQKPEPELARSWRITDGGRKIAFELRTGVSFSDGSPFDAADVVHTFQVLMDPKLHSPVADAFRSGSGPARAVALSSHTVAITFAAPIPGVERHFDSLAILSSRSKDPRKAVLGPFRLAEYRPGSLLLFERNPRYWKKDENGNALPYIDTVRVDIQQNRDIELMQFRRGELHFVSSLDGEAFDRLRREKSGAARDAGASFEAEMLWFNQTGRPAVAAHKQAWFASTAFRRALSEAINRADLVRLAYRGYAIPSPGPVSPANHVWFNASLKPHAHDPAGALRRLAQAGFRYSEGILRDTQGNPVEVSIVTNSGSKVRERMAALIQQDWAKIGVKANIVPLDFPSLIERITRSFDYEACLLGLVNVDPDPNGQMNLWLSSASNHQWNPNQPKPATEWEAEVDRLMRLQASSADHAVRKKAFDEVQRIAWEQAPLLYLVNPNALVAISPGLRNAAPSAFTPRVFWNIDRLQVSNSLQAAR
jgi:peptide/nickel transport system substrate-binding protein